MSITEPWTAAIVLLVLLGSSALGISVQRILSEHHRSAQTTALVSSVIIMLFTFATLVLGLLITDAKSRSIELTIFPEPLPWADRA